MITSYDNARFEAECQPLSHLLDQLNAEKKFDQIRSFSGLKLDDECKLIDGGAKFTSHGFAGLAKLTSMPTAMVAWLGRKQYTGDLARFVNDELLGLEFEDDQSNRPRKRLFARFREDAHGNKLCRAIFSDRYAAIDANVVMEMVASSFSAQERDAAQVHRLSYDGDELILNLIWPGCDRVVGGESYRVGLAIQTSEIGTLRLQISAWIGRLVCENGLIVNSPIGEIISKRHVGRINLNELATNIRQVAGSALSHADQTLRQLDSIRKIEVADAEKTIVQLSRDYRLTTEQANRWLHRHDRTLEEATVSGTSAFSIINGLTSAAKAPEVAPTERVHLESLAGRILAPRFEASFLDIEEHWRRIEIRASMLSDEVLAEFRN